MRVLVSAQCRSEPRLFIWQAAVHQSRIDETLEHLHVVAVEAKDVKAENVEFERDFDAFQLQKRRSLSLAPSLLT